TVEDALLQVAARDEAHLRGLRQLGLTSYICVPLIARGHSLGTLTFLMAESARSYRNEDLPLFEELGRRAGIAIDNTRLYREAQAAIALRDDFLSVAAHELRTPLTSLKLYLQ